MWVFKLIMVMYMLFIILLIFIWVRNCMRWVSVYINCLKINIWEKLILWSIIICWSEEIIMKWLFDVVSLIYGLVVLSLILLIIVLLIKMELFGLVIFK